MRLDGMMDDGWRFFLTRKGSIRYA